MTDLTYASLFGMVLGLASMGMGTLMILWKMGAEYQLTLVAGFLILVASIYIYPQNKQVLEEVEKSEVTPEWPLEERHYQ
jgi:hypothetical protein